MQMSNRIKILQFAFEREEAGVSVTPAQIAKGTDMTSEGVCKYASRHWASENTMTEGLFEPANGTQFGGTPVKEEKDTECRLTNAGAEQYLLWTALQEARRTARSAFIISLASLAVAICALAITTWRSFGTSNVRLEEQQLARIEAAVKALAPDSPQ